MLCEVGCTSAIAICSAMLNRLTHTRSSEPQYAFKDVLFILSFRESVQVIQYSVEE